MVGDRWAFGRVGGSRDGHAERARRRDRERAARQGIAGDRAAVAVVGPRHGSGQGVADRHPRRRGLTAVRHRDRVRRGVAGRDDRGARRLRDGQTRHRRDGVAHDLVVAVAGRLAVHGGHADVVRAAADARGPQAGTPATDAEARGEMATEQQHDAAVRVGHVEVDGDVPVVRAGLGGIHAVRDGRRAGDVAAVHDELAVRLGQLMCRGRLRAARRDRVRIARDREEVGCPADAERRVAEALAAVGVDVGVVPGREIVVGVVLGAAVLAGHVAQRHRVVVGVVEVDDQSLRDDLVLAVVVMGGIQDAVDPALTVETR